MKVPLLDLKAQYETIRSDILLALEDVLESQYFILGPHVSTLEERIAAYSNCQFGIGVSSGTDALLISLMAENIGPGDEVITTPYTFFATAGAIARCGATPVFTDIDTASYNIDPRGIEAKISNNTKAIIPVHLYGQCADMDPILSIARKYGLAVIEDAAQAIGALYPSMATDGPILKKAGSMGDYGCFSFFPSKNLGAFGDAGMVVTNDPERAERLRVLRVHGSKPKYWHKMVGGNFRLDAIQAAVLNVKFKHLEAWTAQRETNAEYYKNAFKSSGIVGDSMLVLPEALWRTRSQQFDLGPESRPSDSSSHPHIYNQYVVRTPKRDALRTHLGERGIGTEVYYPVPLHLQKCFAALGYDAGSFPLSEMAAQETVALPIYPELSSRQLDYVVESCCEYFRQ
jgi:dTDP-4-amino-4,6-dideoxygalactose transaminase